MKEGVAVIEDGGDIREMVKFILEEPGYEATGIIRQLNFGRD